MRPWFCCLKISNWKRVAYYKVISLYEPAFVVVESDRFRRQTQRAHSEFEFEPSPPCFWWVFHVKDADEYAKRCHVGLHLIAEAVSITYFIWIWNFDWSGIPLNTTLVFNCNDLLRQYNRHRCFVLYQLLKIKTSISMVEDH